MKRALLLLNIAPIALTCPAEATVSPAADQAIVTPATMPDTPEEAPKRKSATKPSADMVTTGVARGRDRLDSAVSTSSLKESEIRKLAPRSIADILRDVPGIRSEAATGEGHSNISIRGLPIASTGSKFLQLQEDGLPILEFGDIAFGGSDTFLRADLNLAQVDVIRGGSASTFASNSPGGLINFQSKTGEIEGGAVALTTGLDYGEYRIDLDYGAHLTDTLRFHVGGYYRSGEGPRRTGFTSEKGGQIKANITKEFAGGYIRFYGKYLDERAPLYDLVPVRVSGTNADPKYTDVAGFDANHDKLLARYVPGITTLDGNNNVILSDYRDGQHPVVKSVGVETSFDVHGWNVAEKFRYSNISSHFVGNLIANFTPAATVAASLGGAGATLSYATGPNAGRVITDPASLNGNGLLMPAVVRDIHLKSLANFTNDLRASHVWALGGGELTTTAGIYNSRQTIHTDWLWTSLILDVVGDGNAALVNIKDAGGRSVTQDGVYAYSGALAVGTRFRRLYRAEYGVNAPFGSLNYRFGRFAIGGSLRYDFGRASGSLYGSDLGGGRVGTTTRDINGDGIISGAETRVSIVPLGQPAPIDYGYHYLSYSTGVNWRIADPLAVFARYSKGARINSNRILFTPNVSFTTGQLTKPGIDHDPVKQAEAGVKYRHDTLTLNLTGFWAKAQDTNVDGVTSLPISRAYRAVGLEFEGGYRIGPFSVNGGVTYTDAKIVKDNLNAAVEGNTPRNQAKFVFQATPQITTERFSVGAVFIGTSGSFAQDVDQLRMPGYVTTNAFVQTKVWDGLSLSVNANNLFDVNAFVAIDDPAIPASGIVRARMLTGRNISATLRFDF